MKDTISRVPAFMDGLNLSLQGSGERPLEWMLLTNGDSDPFDSVILFGFEPGSPEPSMVAKVPRMPQNILLLEVEYRSLSEMWSLLGAQAATYLPRPVALLDLAGQSALVISHISGENLARASGRPFWAEEERVVNLAVEAACILRSLNDRASLPLDEAQQPASDFERRAQGFMRLFPLSAREQSVLEQVVQRSEAEAQKARRRVLVQGDFWHGNLIRRWRGSQKDGLAIVDWGFAHWSVDVSCDVYLFLLAAALTGAPYGSEEQRAQGAAALLHKWCARVIPAYLAAYGQPAEYVLLPVREGMLAACVEKAVRPALDFGYSHPDDLMWRLLFAELAGWPDENWILPEPQGSSA